MSEHYCPECARTLEQRDDGMKECPGCGHVTGWFG